MAKVRARYTLAVGGFNLTGRMVHPASIEHRLIELMVSLTPRGNEGSRHPPRRVLVLRTFKTQNIMRIQGDDIKSKAIVPNIGLDPLGIQGEVNRRSSTVMQRTNPKSKPS